MITDYKESFEQIKIAGSLAADTLDEVTQYVVPGVATEKLDKILQPVHSAMFVESNPSPVKYAASLLGMCNPDVRLPLVEVKEDSKKKISEALKVAKIL